MVVCLLWAWRRLVSLRAGSSFLVQSAFTVVQVMNLIYTSIWVSRSHGRRDWYRERVRSKGASPSDFGRVVEVRGVRLGRPCHGQGKRLIHDSCEGFFFRMPPHRRVNGGLGDQPGVTIPGTTFSHPVETPQQVKATSDRSRISTKACSPITCVTGCATKSQPYISFVWLGSYQYHG